MFASEPTQPPAAPGIFDAAVRYRRTTVVVTLIGAALGLLLTILSPTQFTAVGKLTLADPGGRPGLGSSIPVAEYGRYVAERAETMTGTEVLRVAADAFPRAGGVSELRTACSAASSNDSGVVTLECTFGEERTATGAIDAIVAAYRNLTRKQFDQRAMRAIETLQEERNSITEQLQKVPTGSGYGDAYKDAAAVRLAQIDEEIADIRTSQAVFGDGVAAVDPPRVPAGAGFLTKAGRNVIVGGAVGFIGAVLVAWFLADRTPIGESSAEVSSWMELPLLGEVDHELVRDGRIDMLAIPEPAYQRITSNVEAVLSGETVLFTPAEAMALQEHVVIKTALVAARAGKRVLLVDADPAARPVSATLGLPDGPGFAEFATGDASAEAATVRLGFSRTSGAAGAALYLMGPGEEGGQQRLLRTGDAEQALTELRRHYDLILIAGPPLLSSAGSAVLGQAVDGVVLIVERGTPRAAIEDAKRQLRFLASETLGFVFVHGS